MECFKHKCTTHLYSGTKMFSFQFSTPFLIILSILLASHSMTKHFFEKTSPTLIFGSSSQFRVHHYIYQVFPFPMYFSFLTSEFQVLFYCSDAWSSKTLCSWPSKQQYYASKQDSGDILKTGCSLSDIKLCGSLH